MLSRSLYFCDYLKTGINFLEWNNTLACLSLDERDMKLCDPLLKDRGLLQVVGPALFTKSGLSLTF